MAYYVISSENIAATINDQGAEIVKIHGITKNIDYLWDGNPAVWPKTSPVLFPVIGGLKEDTYTYKGEKFKLGRHGFCREKVFKVTEQTKSVITFTLESDASTLAVYPFNFKFSVKHEIKDNQIFVSYIIENTDKKTMLFSVGAHPGFNVPLHRSSGFKDYYLLFSEVENAERYPINKEGLIENKSVPFLENTKEKGLEVNIEIAPEVPQFVLGDPMRLSQVITNLMNNAVKFTHKGKHSNLSNQ